MHFNYFELHPCSIGLEIKIQNGMIIIAHGAVYLPSQTHWYISQVRLWRTLRQKQGVLRVPHTECYWEYHWLIKRCYSINELYSFILIKHLRLERLDSCYNIVIWTLHAFRTQLCTLLISGPGMSNFSGPILSWKSQVWSEVLRIVF